MSGEPFTTGTCSVCGYALSGGTPCPGGFKIEPDKAKAVTDDGFALQHRSVAGGNKESIAHNAAPESGKQGERHEC